MPLSIHLRMFLEQRVSVLLWAEIRRNDAVFLSPKHIFHFS